MSGYTGEKRRRWSPDEDEMVRTVYAARGIAGCVELLPHRSDKSIVQRAMRLGVRSGTRAGWTSAKRTMKAEKKPIVHAPYLRGWGFA